MFQTRTKAQAPSRAMFVTNPDSSPTSSFTGAPPNSPNDQHHKFHHISELSALPRSPEEPLTPPDSDPFKQRIVHEALHQYTLTPLQISDESSIHLLAEYKREIAHLTSQRSIDRQSIARLEADRDRNEDYNQKRDMRQSWVTKQWANGIEEIARKDRDFEELQESEKLRFDEQTAEFRELESELRQQNESLLVALGRLEGIVQERGAGEERARVRIADLEIDMRRLWQENAAMAHCVGASSRRERESEITSRATVEVARAAFVERDNADARNEELRAAIARQGNRTLRFWGSAGSLLAALVMVAVVVESC